MMENTDQNGDIEGKGSAAQGLGVAEEAEELTANINGEVTEAKQSPEATPSDEEVSPQEFSEESSEECLTNGKISEEHSGGKQDLEVCEGKQEVRETIEVVEQLDVVEERQETLEDAQRSGDKVVTETEAAAETDETEVVEKKKILYVAEDVDDLDFSDGPDSPGEEVSVAELIEDERERDETIAEESDEQEEKDEEDTNEEQLQVQQQELVDSEQKTKEPVQSDQTEELTSTKDLKDTKEFTKEEESKNTQEEKTERESYAVQRRRSSADTFRKLKDKFSSETKVDENNKKNEEGENKWSKEKENGSAQGFSNMSDAKSKRFGGTSEKCTQCNKTVYPMEKMEVAGRLLHKTCFKCCKCNSQLNVGRFSIGGKDMYCMTHYKQAFREKGTYDVFTPDNPIKGKWENKAHE